MTTNINLNNAKVSIDNLTGSSQEALWSWLGKWNNNFNLGKGWKAQLSALYQSKTNIPANHGGGMRPGGPQMGGSQSTAHGYVKSIWSMDAGISRSFLKNIMGMASFSVCDIFGTRRIDQYSESTFFIMQTHHTGGYPRVQAESEFALRSDLS